MLPFLLNRLANGDKLADMPPLSRKRAGGSIRRFLSVSFPNVLVAFTILVCSVAAVSHYSAAWNLWRLIPGSDAWRDQRCDRSDEFPRERVFVDADGDGKRECIVRRMSCSPSTARLDEDGFPWVCNDGIWSCPLEAERKEAMDYGRYARHFCVNGEWKLVSFGWFNPPADPPYQPPRVIYGDPGDPEPIEPPCVGDCTDMDGDGRTWNDIDADGDGRYEP